MTYDPTHILQATPMQWIQSAVDFLNQRVLPADRPRLADAISQAISTTVGPANTGLTLLRYKEFIETFPPEMPHIVEGILEPNTVFLLSGSPKSGKSYIALQLAEDIATGRPAFGRFKVNKAGPVVYLILEGPQSQAQR